MAVVKMRKEQVEGQVASLRDHTGTGLGTRVFSDLKEAIEVEALQNFECDHRNELFDDLPRKIKLTKKDFSLIAEDEAKIYFTEAEMILKTEGEGYDPAFADHVKVVYNKNKV